MNANDLERLTREIVGYKTKHSYQECFSIMEKYETETADPIVKAIVLTAQATCALNLGKLAIAEKSLARVSMKALPEEIRSRVKLVKAAIAHAGHRLDEANQLLAEVLSISKYTDDSIRYEATARKGFVQAELDHFSEALDLLIEAFELDKCGEFSQNILLYKAYCLQALGELDDAEDCLNTLLGSELTDIQADVYYRLGAVHLQKRQFAFAMMDFENALQSLPNGAIQRDVIEVALSETKMGLAKSTGASI